MKLHEKGLAVSIEGTLRLPNEVLAVSIHGTNIVCQMLETAMTNNVGLGLPLDWKTGLIGWARGNSSIRELWLFGNRAKGIARVNSVVDLGLCLTPANRRHDWAFENFIALHADWRGELETLVQCHVSLVPMILGNEGDVIIRSTGICLWERLSRRKNLSTNNVPTMR